MDGQDIDFAVKYPFTDEARAILKNKKTEINNELATRALERIKKALGEGLEQSGAIHGEEKIAEIATYATARVILGSLRNSFITNKYAVAESKRVRRDLDSDDIGTALRLGSELGVVAESDSEKTFMMDIPTYLSFCPRDRAYRLINRQIYYGKVKLNKEEIKRLIEEAVRKHIEQTPLPKDPPEMIQKAGEKLLDLLPKPKISTVEAKPGDHPPCIEKVLESAGKHQNLPHTARWLLAVYLIRIGMNDEQITAIYAGLPDFSERITRYQVEHARKKAYTVPSCSTVNTYGLCIARCRIGNPINWHTRRKK
jgi:DNA primase large subunit